MSSHAPCQAGAALPERLLLTWALSHLAWSEFWLPPCNASDPHVLLPYFVGRVTQPPSVVHPMRGFQKGLEWTQDLGASRSLGCQGEGYTVKCKMPTGQSCH